MQETLPWIAVAMAGGSTIAVASFWMKMGAKLAKADSAERMASVALAKGDLVASQLAEYKVEATKAFASTTALAAAEHRLSAALEGLNARFDRMADRFDRFIETMLERDQRRDGK